MSSPASPIGRRTSTSARPASGTWPPGKDIGVFWGTQIFPFADAASVTGYLEMETAVYGAING